MADRALLVAALAGGLACEAGSSGEESSGTTGGMSTMPSTMSTSTTTTGGPDPCTDNQDGNGDPSNAQEALGTQAQVVWSTSSDSGFERTSDVDVDFSYRIAKCSSSPTSQCIALTRLAATTSDFTVEGIPVQSPRFELISVATTPVVDSSGQFRFPAGEVELALDYHVMGVRRRLTATNSATVSGRVVPGSNIASLSPLAFAYSDSVLSATLTVDYVGAYVQRAPIADFARVSDPRLCSEAVVFDATSRDADGDSLTHNWDISGFGSYQGDTLSVALPAGTYEIALLAEDTARRFDVEEKTYTRVCQ